MLFPLNYRLGVLIILKFILTLVNLATLGLTSVLMLQFQVHRMYYFYFTIKQQIISILKHVNNVSLRSSPYVVILQTGLSQYSNQLNGFSPLANIPPAKFDRIKITPRIELLKKLVVK